MKKLLCATVLIWVFVSLANGQTTTQRIEANAKAFAEALNKGDAASVAGFYATDAKLMPPNSKLVEGRANIQKFWADAASAGLKISLTTSEVNLSGTAALTGAYAIETGKYITTMPGANGVSITDEGKYVVVWRQELRGRWKIVRDIWNTDKPTQ